MSTDFMDKLEGAKRRRRTLSITLRGDLQERYERLERELMDAERAQVNSPSDSLEEEPAALRVAREMEAVAAEMREESYTFVLEALGGPRYRALKAAHPPRRDDDGNILPEDRQFDVNIDDFGLPLLRASLVDPVLTDAQWVQVDDQLSEGQYSQLISAALMVNVGDVDIPFSLAASRRLSSTASE